MGVLFIVMFIFIINTVYALSEEDKDFCKFVAEKVFTRDEYRYIDKDGLTAKKTIDPYTLDSSYSFDINKIIKFEQFEVFISEDHPNKCHIRGRFVDNNSFENKWSTALEIVYSETFNGSKKTFIIPKKAQSDSDNHIQFLQRVEWDKVIGEDRKSFKEVWNLDNTKERKRILETCHEKYSTHKDMMTCLSTELKTLTPKPKEKEEGEKNQQANDGQQNDNKQKTDKVNDDEQKADDGEEKTIFANTCFTVSLTLTLGILWFFVLLYIRNTYCLTSTESQEEYEYEEESMYDFV